MSNYKIDNSDSLRSSYKCEICSKHKHTKMYEYQSYSFVRNHEPKHFKEICAECIYKECYGTKNWRIKKKEGSLDDTPK